MSAETTVTAVRPVARDAKRESDGRTGADSALSSDTGTGRGDTTLTAQSDSSKMMGALADSARLDPCAADTSAPWIYPDPSGGLHRQELTIRLLATKPCEIEWRFKGEQAWRRYEDGAVKISQTTDLEYRGADACGNAMAERSEHYQIATPVDSDRCPPGMELISVGETEFCIDRYEWPNRKGARPATFVSLYQAMDSCMSKGKRLCSSDEWKVACAGPYGWTYLYGDRFEPRACITTDTAVAPSGSRPECRGYFDVFDMSGNALEWTSTRSSANNRFYNVMGGFWESGSQSRCFDTRYSYFPQNRHNPVSFRCCADASAPPAGKRGAKGGSK
jgi:hypothetical protein